jgi:gamma-glutamyltranspeptidase
MQVTLGALPSRLSSPCIPTLVHPHPGFYSGRIAEAIVAALRERGGVMSLQDLADHRAVACEPMCTTYRCVDRQLS